MSISKYIKSEFNSFKKFLKGEHTFVSEKINREEWVMNLFKIYTYKDSPPKNEPFLLSFYEVRTTEDYIEKDGRVSIKPIHKYSRLNWRWTTKARWENNNFIIELDGVVQCFKKLEQGMVWERFPDFKMEVENELVNQLETYK